MSDTKEMWGKKDRSHKSGTESHRPHARASERMPEHMRPTTAARVYHKAGALTVGHKKPSRMPTRRESLFFGQNGQKGQKAAVERVDSKTMAKQKADQAEDALADAIVGESSSFDRDGEMLTRSEVLYHSCVSMTGEHGISAETPLQRAIGCGWIFFIFMMVAVYTAGLTAYISNEQASSVQYANIFECIENSDSCLFCLQNGSANAGFFTTDDAYVHVDQEPPFPTERLLECTGREVDCFTLRLRRGGVTVSNRSIFLRCFDCYSRLLPTCALPIMLSHSKL